MGSPSAVLSVGFGSWGSVGEVITLGFGSGADASYGWLEYSAQGTHHYSARGNENQYTAQGLNHYGAEELNAG